MHRYVNIILYTYSQTDKLETAPLGLRKLSKLQGEDYSPRVQSAAAENPR